MSESLKARKKGLSNPDDLVKEFERKHKEGPVVEESFLDKLNRSLNYPYHDEDDYDRANRLAEKEKMSPLEKLSASLDYPGNFVRHNIRGAMEGENPLKTAEDAFNYYEDGKTSGTQLKDSFTKNVLGMDKPFRLGKDGPNDGVFSDTAPDWFKKYITGTPTDEENPTLFTDDPIKGFNQNMGDMKDIGIDAAIDIYSDPLLALPRKVLKGASKLSSSIANKVTKAAGKNVNKAANYVGVVEHAGPAAAGFIYGMGMDDGNSDIWDKLENGLTVGTAVGLGKSKVVRDTVNTYVGKVADVVIDGFKGKDFSKQFEIANDAAKKVNRNTSIFQRQYNQVFEKLSPDEKLVAFDMIKALNSNQTGYRNFLIEDGAKTEYLNLLRAKRKLKKWDKPKRDPQYKKLQNDFLEAEKAYLVKAEAASEKAYNAVSIEHIRDKFKDKVTDRIENSLDDWQKFKKKQIDMYNKAQTDEKFIIKNGIKYHFPNYMIVEKTIKDMENIKPGMNYKFRTHTKEGNLHGELTKSYIEKGMKEKDAALKAYDDIALKYNEDLAKKLIDKPAREAIIRMQQNMQKVRDPSLYDTTPKKAWGYAIKGWDELNNWWKSNILGFSTSYHKNIFGDNLLKAFIESGMKTTLKNSLMHKYIESGFDFSKLGRGKAGKLNDPYREIAYRNGVVDSNLYREEMGDEITDLLNAVDKKVSGSQKSKTLFEMAAEKSEIAAGLKKVDDAIQNLIVKPSLKVGEAIENEQRFMLFKDLSKHLSKERFADLRKMNDWDVLPATTRKTLEKQALRDVHKEAAAIVERAFFNYSDIHYFEKAVMKRLIPFYTFFSKNVKYWGDAILRHPQYNQIQKYRSTYDNIGEDMSKEERQTIPGYRRDYDPRKIGETDDGGQKLLYGRNMSDVEAVRSVSNLESVLSQANPLVKLGVEWITGKDLMDKSDLDMDTANDAYKKLYSSGYKYQALNSLIDSIPVLSEKVGRIPVSSDDHGRPVTSNEFVIWFDKLMHIARPHGLVNQILSILMKNEEDSLDYQDRFINLLTPYHIGINSVDEQEGSDSRTERDKSIKINNLLKRKEVK